jgi:Predicted membrane protein (DUF2142)
MSRRLPRTWAKTFLLVLSLTVLWTLSTPLFAAPDEPAHVLKAVAAARGQLSGPSVAGRPAAVMQVTVPAGYATAGQVPDCFDTLRTEPAGCARDLTYETGLVQTTTYVGHYPALYYLLVGWPSRFIASPDAAVYAMRLTSDVFSAAFLSLALALLLTQRRKGGLPVLGVVIALTPQALFLASVVNPAGLAISAAICLWTSGLRLVTSTNNVPESASVRGLRVLGQDGLSKRALLAIVALCALVEAFTVALAPLWVAITVILLVAAASASRRRELERDGDLHLTVAALVLGVSAAGLLVWRNDSLAVLGSSRSIPAGASDLEVLLHAVSWLPTYVAQAIGAMGWLETRPPLVTYLIWGLLLLAVAVAALRFGSRRMRLVLLAGGAISLLAPTLITVSQARALRSIVWEGKDGMPLWVGLPILAVGASATWWSEHPRVAHGLIGAAGVAQFTAFLGALHRYTVGDHGSWSMISRVTDGWSPPLPALVLVGLYAAVLIVAWRVLVYRPVGPRRVDLMVLSRGAKKAVKDVRALR